MKSCEVCKTGQMHSEKVPSIQISNGQLIIIPDVPSLVCDRCQHTILDPQFLEQIDFLFDQKALRSYEESPVDNDQSLLHQSLLWAQVTHF